jgi:hypothetical protein
MYLQLLLSGPARYHGKRISECFPEFELTEDAQAAQARDDNNPQEIASNEPNYK